MKKSILGLLFASTFGISIAEYRMALPMEVKQGGALPNGSISFAGGPPAVVEFPGQPEARDECMPAAVGVYSWRVNRTNGAGAVIWNGTTVSNFASGTTSVSGANGIVYTKDETTSAVPQGPSNLFGICRNIPGDFNGGSWVSIAPVVTAWVNSGSAYNCTWTPDPANFLTTQSVDQMGTNCLQKQERIIQIREQNDSTFDIRNSGSATKEYQDIYSNEYLTRTVSGTETTTEDETCINDSYTSTVWFVDLTNNNNVGLISWKGFTLILNENIGDITTFNFNGVVYKRGVYIGYRSAGEPEVIYGYNYGVCRVNN